MTKRRGLIPFAGKEHDGKLTHHGVDMDSHKRRRIQRMIDDKISIDKIAARTGIPRNKILAIAEADE